jgi:hypothetical protein
MYAFVCAVASEKEKAKQSRRQTILQVLFMAVN